MQSMTADEAKKHFGQLLAEVRVGLDQLDRGEGEEMDAAGIGKLMDGVKADGRKRADKPGAD